METTSSSGESSISMAAVQSIIDKLRLQKNHSSTTNSYYRIWKKFNEFFIKLDSKPSCWEDRLVLFVGYLINMNRQSSTIKSYISAIKSVLRDDGEVINEDTYLLNSLTRACCLHKDHVHTRLPIRKSLLLLLVKNTSLLLHDQPFLQILIKAMLVTAYYGLFRIREITYSQHVLKAKDVRIGRNKGKMMFVLHTSKTHGLDAKPQIIKINSLGYTATGERKPKPKTKFEEEFCPFEILQAYLRQRNGCDRDDEPFFVLSDRSPVTAYIFHFYLKKLLTFTGLDESLYGSHSLRAGRASDMLHLYSISVETIKKIGR